MGRKKTWFLLLLAGLAIVGVVIAGLFFARSTRLGEIGRSEEGLEEVAGDMEITSTAPVSLEDFGGEVGFATLNKLVVQRASLNKTGPSGSPELELQTTFDFEGKKRWLSVHLVNSIQLEELRAELSRPESRKVPVSELSLNAGDFINITFVYLPEKNPIPESGLSRFCEYLGSLACWTALEQGFGGNPVNFDNYIRGLFVASDKAALNYNTVFPAKMSVIQ